MLYVPWPGHIGGADTYLPDREGDWPVDAAAQLATICGVSAQAASACLSAGHADEESNGLFHCMFVCAVGRFRLLIQFLTLDSWNDKMERIMQQLASTSETYPEVELSEFSHSYVEIVFKWL